MTVMHLTPAEPERRLQTVPAEMVPLLLEALNTTVATGLLLEAHQHLAHPDHNRHDCDCDTCGLFRRISRHLRRDR